MPIIELINASIFQNNTCVLENVNIEVAKGDFVFLIGRTGSGKSSLIKVLYGDLTLKEGIGNVVGFNLLKISQKQIPFLRRKIGVVFHTEYDVNLDETNKSFSFLSINTQLDEKNLLKTIKIIFDILFLL